MPFARLLLTLCAAAAPALAAAAPTPYLTVDHSAGPLMERSVAEALWKEQLSARLYRLYPSSKWGFASHVEGGFDEAKVCVVTARAMMLPRAGKTLVLQPAKTATAFGAQPNLTMQQCQSLAKAKLGEAIGGVRAALAQ